MFTFANVQKSSLRIQTDTNAPLLLSKPKKEKLHTSASNTNSYLLISLSHIDIHHKIMLLYTYVHDITGHTAECTVCDHHTL